MNAESMWRMFDAISKQLSFLAAHVIVLEREVFGEGQASETRREFIRRLMEGAPVPDWDDDEDEEDDDGDAYA